MTQKQPLEARPIILRSWEVRAVLAGTLIQIWRPMESGQYARSYRPYEGDRDDDGWPMACAVVSGCLTRVACPWRDWVWGRETLGRGTPGNPWAIVYEVDQAPVATAQEWDWPHVVLGAACMPRWASRITLEIEQVSALPVQNVTEADARAAGIKKFLPPHPFPVDWPKNGQGKYTSAYGLNYASDRSRFARSAVEAFARQWDIDNPRHPWGGNPQAWRLVVRRVES